MDLLQETKDLNKKNFLSHVFSTTEDGKAEILNVIQYSLMGVIPIVVLNKFIQKFVPEADGDKSSLEILFEIFVQLVIMFCGIILIHRTISYFPTYSGFKYENFVLTNVILAFLVIVLSIQTKLGLKVNILVDRVYDLWNGTSSSQEAGSQKKNVRVSQQGTTGPHHNPSQADYLDNSHIQNDMFPPAPVAVSRPNNPMGSMPPPSMNYETPLMPANSLLGGSFGSNF